MASATGVGSHGRCKTAAIAFCLGSKADPAVAAPAGQAQTWLRLWTRHPANQQAARVAWRNLHGRIVVPAASSENATAVASNEALAIDDPPLVVAEGELESGSGENAKPEVTLVKESDVKIIWKHVAGVMGATIAVLTQAGWSVRHPEPWRSPGGTLYNVGNGGSIAEAVRVIQAEAAQVLWKEAAKQYHGKGLESGVCMQATCALLTALRQKEEFGRAALLETLLAAATWPHHRRAEVGLEEPGPCKRDGCDADSPEDMMHLLYRCPATCSLDIPDVQETAWLVELAEKGVAEFPCLWLRGILPSSVVHIDPAQEELDLFLCGAHPGDSPWPAGCYHTDGSGGEFSSVILLRRCGCGVAVVCRRK